MSKVQVAGWVLAVLCGCLAGEASAVEPVRGHFRKDGSYVQPHLRSKPDGIKINNYSYRAPSSPKSFRPSSGSSSWLKNLFGK